MWCDVASVKRYNARDVTVYFEHELSDQWIVRSGLHVVKIISRQLNANKCKSGGLEMQTLTSPRLLNYNYDERSLIKYRTRTPCTDTPSQGSCHHIMTIYSSWRNDLRHNILRIPELIWAYYIIMWYAHNNYDVQSAVIRNSGIGLRWTVMEATWK